VLKGPRALLVTVLAIAAATPVTSAGPAAVAWAHAELIGLVLAAGAGGLWWVFGRERRT
jgi:hypothetical protein